MNCKYHKIRTKKGIKYGYCTLYKKEVSLFGCKCESIERKMYNNRSMNVKNDNNMHSKCKNIVKNPIKKRSYSLAKKEKNRYSIIYQDLTKCAICGSLATDLNEVYEGSYRQISIKYGMIMPMCRNCHTKFHENRTFALYYKILFEKEFLKTHTLDEWLSIFKIDYRYKK